MISDKIWSGGMREKKESGSDARKIPNMGIRIKMGDTDIYIW